MSAARTRNQEERYRTLLEINNAVVGCLRKSDLLQAISVVMARALPCDHSGMGIYDRERDDVVIHAAHGEFAADVGVGFYCDYKGERSGAPWDFRAPLLSPDLTISRNRAFEQALYLSGVRSSCAVPLIVRGETIGTLGIGARAPNRYSQDDLDFLQEIGNQIAPTVANMLAFEEITALKARLQAENRYLQEEIQSDHNFDAIVGRSAALQECLAAVKRVAPIDSTVLLLGETGTGKELLARAIHDLSPRRSRPLVKVNCGAIAPGLIESELFGHVKGAFTGALSNRDGRFTVAHKGTIFLDEIGELPLDSQVKLLRVLQEREFEPLGSGRTVQVDVRVIAATNRDLAAAVAAGTFRADLYYRVNVFPIEVPPLRARAGDIPLLAYFIGQEFAKRTGLPLPPIDQDTMRRLEAYPWPGNIRELHNVIERGIILSNGTRFVVPAELETGADAGGTRSADVAPTSSTMAAGEALSLDELVRRHIRMVLKQTHGVIEGPHGAARQLGLKPNTLRSRMKKLGIGRDTGCDSKSETSNRGID